MDQAAVRDAVEKTQCILNLERRIIGVRFIFEESEFAEEEARPLAARVPYCVMVKRAMRGHALRAVDQDFGCRASARMLGFVAPDEFFSSGRHYRRLGLYKDLVTAKQVRRNMTVCSHQAHGIVLKPLEEFAHAPDVVLMVGTPYAAMRVMQAYTYQFGYQTDIKMAGNQGICSECTAHPFENDCINVSMLCAGTRFMAGWRDDELGIGFPFNRFLPVAEGVWATANAVEPDRKKRRIEQRLAACGRTDLEMEYGKNYYTGLYLTQK